MVHTMRLGRLALTVAVICLLVLSSGCIGKRDEPTIRVKLDVLGSDEQNVVQGNNTTFMFLAENNWKENATLLFSVGKMPKDWTYELVPESVELDKNKGATFRLNISVPSTAQERGHTIKVKVKAQGSDIHKKSKEIRVFPLTDTISPELDIVDQGDVVYVNYTGFLLNGQVFDTTIEEIAENPLVNRSDSFQPRTIYEPAPFHPLTGELVKGFEEGFANMRAGESKAFFVHEDQAYSRYEEETINLTETIPLTEKWRYNDFQRAFRQDPAMHLVVTHRKWGWNATVTSITDDEVRMVSLRLLVEPGYLTTAYGWDSTVASVDSSANGGVGEIVLSHDPKMDTEVQLYNSTAPKEFDFGEVLEITDTQVTVRVQTSHHALAGEHLIFVVEIDRFQQ